MTTDQTPKTARQQLADKIAALPLNVLLESLDTLDAKGRLNRTPEESIVIVELNANHAARMRAQFALADEAALIAELERLDDLDYATMGAKLRNTKWALIEALEARHPVSALAADEWLEAQMMDPSTGNQIAYVAKLLALINAEK